jgi:iron complex transport system substrate-binding protein
MRNLFYTLILILLFYSCEAPNSSNANGELVKNSYSERFEILETHEGYILKVFDRFNENQSIDYVLSSKDNNGIKIPIKKAICLSTTHCAFISQLEQISTIKGIGGTEYVYNPDIRKLINSNKIVDIGYDNLIDYEKVIAINPDVIFAFGVDNGSMAGFNKLIELGVPVIYVNDFLENHPLGRTEWIKFFGCFYDNLEYATHFFDSIAHSYTSILNNVKNIQTEKPKVIVGLPWQGSWWVPGGNSFFANFIKDAGGDYIYSDNQNFESIPHSLEEIYITAQSADVWLNPNAITKREEIIDVDSRLKNFAPTHNAKIFNNNKRTNMNGGNDFWEAGILYPDVILKDLKIVFYPDYTSNNDSLFYYKEIE